MVGRFSVAQQRHISTGSRVPVYLRSGAARPLPPLQVQTTELPLRTKAARRRAAVRCCHQRAVVVCQEWPRGG